MKREQNAQLNELALVLNFESENSIYNGTVNGDRSLYDALSPTGQLIPWDIEVRRMVVENMTQSIVELHKW